MTALRASTTLPVPAAPPNAPSQPAARPPAADGHPLRADIQAMRALAIALVVGYHLFPTTVPGGFVGVDVFFGISGFLITGQLLRRPPTSGGSLLGFWARRVRRLLPAAVTVLLALLVVSRLVAPETSWGRAAAQARAAALYVVNWRLAQNSVNYLDATKAPSPVEHFWSLSVEEQFYLVWPLLIALLLLLAGRRRIRRSAALGAGLGAVALGSLAYSVHETAVAPAAAYFVTPTRLWELAAGGLLAVLEAARRDAPHPLPVPAAARSAAAWGGLALIFWSAFSYNQGTPFPGWRAGVPVLGVLLVMAARSRTAPASPYPLFRVRGVQWLGDVSYSVYLWHWPLIVLVPCVSGGRLGYLDKAAIVAASLLLAALSKRYIEDPFRRSRVFKPVLRAYALGAAGVAAVVALATVQLVDVNHRATTETAATRAVTRTVMSGRQERCVGAAAMVQQGCDPLTRSGDVVPGPLVAGSTSSLAWHTKSGGNACVAGQPSFPMVSCTFGDPRGTKNVALIGNSHAADILPALDTAAKKRHWKVTSYLILGCALADVPQAFPTQQAIDACTRWNHDAMRALLAHRWDLVVMSNRAWAKAVGSASLAASAPAYERGYASVLRRFQAAGLRVLVVRDTPYPGHSVPDCVSANPDDYLACAGRRSSWLTPDTSVAALRSLHDPHMRVADLSRYLCTATRCPAVIGKVLVYFDGSHLTEAFARTLAPYLAPYVADALKA
jgi:peptidoglycan/LPS O-acetylase OafA/YrhL